MKSEIVIAALTGFVAMGLVVLGALGVGHEVQTFMRQQRIEERTAIIAAANDSSEPLVSGGSIQMPNMVVWSE